MYCPTCGKEVNNNKFCSGCGEKIDPQGLYEVDKPETSAEQSQNSTTRVKQNVTQFLSVKKNLYITVVVIFGLLLLLNIMGVFESDSSKAKVVADKFLTAQWNIVTGVASEADKDVLSQFVAPGEKGIYSFELGQLRTEASRNKLTKYSYEIQSASAKGDSATVTYKIDLSSATGRNFEVQRLLKLRKVSGQWLVVQDRG
ncbi:hypothetical protein SRRS_06560 [Sporomusa rhizae]|uniref:hypothetical protein n=1 Tax=Sporomusa rhizae TaxID=357999 RepID=UPI00352A3174